MGERDSERTGIELVTSAVGDAVGAAVGFGVGATVAGPVGAIGGAVAGGAIGSLMKGMMDDFLGRLLSAKEQERVQTVAELAKAHIEKDLTEGRQPRSDGFFDEGVSGRSSAAELFEGTLLTAQREFEEKKLPYIANLTANIVFDETVSPAMADRLLKIAGELTFRQLVILRVVAQLQIYEDKGPLPSGKGVRRDEAYGELTDINDIALASDLYDLYRRSLIFSEEVVFGPASIIPSKLYVAGYGSRLYNLMELHAMSRDDEDTKLTNAFLMRGKRLE